MSTYYSLAVLTSSLSSPNSTQYYTSLGSVIEHSASLSVSAMHCNVTLLASCCLYAAHYFWHFKSGQSCHIAVLFKILYIHVVIILFPRGPCVHHDPRSVQNSPCPSRGQSPPWSTGDRGSFSLGYRLTYMYSPPTHL